MSDLYMGLRYMTVAELRRTSRELAADAPGWFVEAYRNEGYERVVKLTRVTDADALHIAHSLDGALGHGGKLFSAVTAMNEKHALELRDLRERAEQQIRDATRTIEQANAALGDR